MDTILLFGYDRHLLESRAWLLERVGYEVLTASNFSQFKAIQGNVRLIILCHTLSAEDCGKAETLRVVRWPGAKELKLPAHAGDEQDDNGEDVLTPINGPERLLHSVRDLLHPRLPHVVAMKRPNYLSRPLARVK